MPDVDVDFDTSRRDEVIAWMHERWGEAHTAMTATVVTFRLRMAVREMGKVLGFPLPLLAYATKLLPHAGAKYVREFKKELVEALGDSPALEVLCSLVESLDDCPRHLSLHSGGMILSRQPLRYLSPIQTSANGVRQIQFSKDDVERLGLIKFDVLGLRMLATVSEAQSLIESTDAKSTFDVDNLPDDDPATYELIRSGETLGLFQIESPGQWNLLSKVQPEHFDDLVVQVALFRPGPLQGNMVHPYILRRRGLVQVGYPHPSLESTLEDTFGVILFQEQVLEVAHVFAGLPLSEADEFRKLMSKFRDASQMESMREKFVNGAITTHQNTKYPVSKTLANRVFDLVAKFVGYGFCRSHAAAFARTVYQSAYLKAHYPTQYMAGVLQHQPGFYPMQTLLEEARRLGVPVLPPCLHRSQVKYSLETDLNDTLSIRVPFSQIDGISDETASSIVLERALAPFRSLDDALERLRLPIDDWENLARSGALAQFGERREVLWEVRAFVREQYGIKGKRQYNPDQLRLDVKHIAEPPPLSILERSQLIDWDFQTQSLTTGAHPLTLHRAELNALGILSIADLKTRKAGRIARAGGSVISRQRPPTAKGMCFIILQDETGYVPTAMTPQVYERFARALRAPQLVIEGTVEDSGKLAGNCYRSILITRLWPLEKICARTQNINRTGAAGHPGENPRATTTSQRQSQRTAVHI
jgi:error-prone DNA polymerase